MHAYRDLLPRSIVTSECILPSTGKKKLKKLALLLPGEKEEEEEENNLHVERDGCGCGLKTEWGDHGIKLMVVSTSH